MATQVGRYTAQQNPNGTNLPANARAVRQISAFEVAGDALKEAAEPWIDYADRQQKAQNELYLTQRTSADELEAQDLLNNASRNVQPGGSIESALAQEWGKRTSQKLAEVKDPVLQAEYAKRLSGIQNALIGKAKSFDTDEKDRYTGQLFEQSVQNKAKFYGTLSPDEVDGKLETDLGELNSIISKAPVAPAQRQKMQEYMLKYMSDAAVMRKIEQDPQSFLVGQALGRTPQSRMTDTSLPRGIRNNNPGNIRASGDAWQGATGKDSGDYLQFETPEMGLCAMAINLKNQQAKNGLNTVQDIITKYAPPEDNNPTGKYIMTVANSLGVKPDEKINLQDPETLATMMQAIIKVENGQQPYSGKSIAWAASAALDAKAAGEAPGVVRADGGVRTGSTAWNLGTYEQQREWINKAESRVREIRAEQSRLVTQGNTLIGTVKERMERGQVIPDEEMGVINQYVQAAGVPELSASWQRVQGQQQAVQQYMRMNPTELRNLIDTTLVPAVNAGGATREEADRLEIAQKTLTAMDTELKSDPLGWYARSGGQVPALDLTDANAMNQRRALARTLSESYAVPIDKALFTPQEATQFVNSLKAATPEVQLKSAMLFANAFGKDTDEAAAIFEKDVPLFGYAASMLYANPAGIKTANDMLAGAALLQSDKASGFDNKGFETAIADWEGYFNNPLQYAAMKKAAEAVYAARNFGKQPDDTAISQAIEDVVGGQRARINGNKVITPPGVDADTFESWMQTLTQDKLKAMSGGVLPSHSGKIFDPQKEPVRLRTIGPGLYYMEGSNGLPLAGNGPNGLAVLNVTAQDIARDIEGVRAKKAEKQQQQMLDMMRSGGGM